MLCTSHHFLKGGKCAVLTREIIAELADDEAKRLADQDAATDELCTMCNEYREAVGYDAWCKKPPYEKLLRVWQIAQHIGYRRALEDVYSILNGG